MKASVIGIDILERIDSAINRVTHGEISLRVPADKTDIDLVLADAKKEIEGLRGALKKSEAYLDENGVGSPVLGHSASGRAVSALATIRSALRNDS